MTASPRLTATRIGSTEASLRAIAQLSGAEHEHQYMHGGCPECGIFYDPEWPWQHAVGCSRATPDEPARERYGDE